MEEIEGEGSMVGFERVVNEATRIRGKARKDW